MKNPLLLFCFIIFSLSNRVAFGQHNVGDTITFNNRKVKVLSANLIANPGFENGFASWTDGTGITQITSAKFTNPTTGGINNSRYLVGTTNEGAAGSGSIATGWPVENGKTYYFSYNVKNLSATAAESNEIYLKVSLTNSKTAVAEPVVLLNSGVVGSAGKWTQNAVIFTNSSSYAFAIARFRWLSNRFGFDNFSLHEVSELINTDTLQQTIADAELIYNAGAKGAADLQTAINTAKSFLTSSSGELVAKAIVDLRAAIRTYKILNASPAVPFDMTSLIANPGFNDNVLTGWTGGGAVNYHVVEFYEKTFNFYQRISGLPAGKYALKAKGYERPKSNDAGAAYTAGTETIYAKLYASSNNFSEKNVPFNSIYKHPYTGGGNNNGFVNTMAGAEIMFNDASNYYDMNLQNLLLDQGDVLTIGTKSGFRQTGYWALFDNFRLEYQGSFSDADYVAFINDRIIKSQELLTAKIQNSAAQIINAAITQGQQAINANPLVTSNLVAAKDALNAAIVTANLSIKTYATLQKAIDYANKVLGWYTDEPAKTDVLQPAVNTANVSINDLTLTLAQINQATADLTAVTKTVDKRTYVPGWMLGDVTNPENNWSNARSVQSKDWIIFWEKGFNTENPDSLYYETQKCDVDWVFDLTEKSFHHYADTLKFINKGSSKTDDYKMIIRLRYTADWEASGSGVDNTIGLLTLTPWAYNSRGGQTVAHEVGHCFQYQVHCDNNDQNGWMYGYGANASGSNGWWEQCAQWQAYQIIPAQQFTSEWFGGYLNAAHKHTMHETPRYNNYFIQDYWADLHGKDIIGRLWNKSVKPEDPIEAYKRITNISQTQFNDEMYVCGARFASWDIAAIRANGASRIASRPQPKMNDAGNDFWRIDPTVCLENYGHNIIQLNTPAAATLVTASFEGLAGTSGYRTNYLTEAGWRYGFVALLNDGSRVYGQMKAVEMTTNEGKDSLTFECPANCARLWLVVSGAPKSHWRHAWDDNDANDEQWPYQVRFGNTNLLGRTNVILPVTQTSFVIQPVNGKAKLSWSTSSETNNKGFYIERSADGQQFNSISFVAGAGTSNQVNNYSFTDNLPLAGKSYYRLRQEDADGKKSYSRTLLFSVDGIANVFVYPNPFTNNLQINTGGSTGIFMLRDAGGRIVKTAIANGNTTLQLSVNELPAGNYFWQINNQSGKVVK